MRRIVLWLASTITVVVLMFGYHTSTTSASGSSRTRCRDPDRDHGPSTSAPSTTSPSTTTPSTSSPSTSSTGTKTYTGSVAQTRWGPVQVEITASDGKITRVNVVQYPTGNPKDAEINDYALPILVNSTLSAQSAQIDMVSGATVTSTGYVQSLQSALDEARI